MPPGRMRVRAALHLLNQRPIAFPIRRALIAVACQPLGRQHAAARLLRTLPEALAPSYAALLAMPEDYQPLVRAADKLAAYIKCIEERTSGNTEFSQAEQSTRAALEALAMPEVTYFLAHFIPSFDLTLDELER